jgi:uncharacterized Zn finger protein (UPF0148 family)
MKCPKCGSPMVQGMLAGDALSCNCSVTMPQVSSLTEIDQAVEVKMPTGKTVDMRKYTDELKELIDE